jgi:enoyl-CoA hydratase/carnithine racemase
VVDGLEAVLAEVLIAEVLGDAADHATRSAAVANPIASAALALLLRSTEGIAVETALVAESATYSALQAGPEHEAWLRARQPKQRGTDEEPVFIRRDGDVLRLTLNRPAVHNAFSAALRDALLEGLAVAAADPVVQVVIDGAGPTFCSGGDLDEFGTRPDPATAHLIRVARSVGRAIHDLRDRTTVRVHGRCVGAGVELPAFAGRVVADPGTTFRLPEVGMGLVPGAGGTVSLPRRIGVERTAWLALTGNEIDAATALSWGLVDELT